MQRVHLPFQFFLYISCKMTHYSRFLSVVLAVTMAAMWAAADIVQTLNSGNSSVHVEQPAALAKRLQETSATADSLAEDEEAGEDQQDAYRATGPKRRIVGFRVQVYADNNARVAKGEARHRERAVAARFPRYATYVAYSSPYWRLRVGDFRTQAEAQRAAQELRAAFPAFAREVRVVRDHVYVR